MSGTTLARIREMAGHSQSKSGDSSLVRVKTMVKSKKKPKSAERKGTIQSALTFEPIFAALLMLRNNSEEFKCRLTGTTKFVVEPALLKGVRGMFNVDKEYRFRLGSILTILSDGGGNIDKGENFQISTTEWGYLTVLFDEVVLYSATIHLAVSGNWIAPLIASPSQPRVTMLVCSLPGTQTPYSSATLIANAADVAMLPPLAVRPLKLTYKCPSTRPWCTTADPAGTTLPTSIPSGTMGCFSLNALGETTLALTASTPYYHMVLSNIIKLRIRT